MNQLSAPYRLWLESHHYSRSTIKNYLVDLNKFFEFAGSQIFSVDVIAAFIDSLNRDPNLNRYQSSLSKFFQFAQDQKLIETNPITNIKNRRISSPSNDLDQLLAQYQNYLNKKHFSPATIKNYLNDLRQYLSWAEAQNHESN